MFSALIVDDNSRTVPFLEAILRHHGLRVFAVPSEEAVFAGLNESDVTWDVIVVNVSAASENWPRFVRTLFGVARRRRFTFGPLVICVAFVKKPALFQLKLEREGARYVHVFDCHL